MAEGAPLNKCFADIVSPDRSHRRAKGSVPRVSVLCGGAPACTHRALGAQEGAVEREGWEVAVSLMVNGRGALLRRSGPWSSSAG